MKLKYFLKKLERKKIITKKPHPIYPFLLAFLSLTALLIMNQANKLTELSSEAESLLINLLLILTIFTFIFAIIHLIVIKMLES